MRAALLACLLALLGLTGPAQAQDRGLAAASTDQLIEVTSDYQGAVVTIFGATPDRRLDGDIVVTLRGPPQRMQLRRKRRMLGLWINADPVTVTEAPAFFALFATRPLDSVTTPRQIWALDLDPAALAVIEGETPADADAGVYRAALVRLMRRSGLYAQRVRDLTVGPGGLFTAKMRLPANAPVGLYTWNVHYFRNGRLIDSQEGEVAVSKAGLERAVFDAAVSRPRIYGLATVALALIAGWLVTLVFRRS